MIDGTGLEEFALNFPDRFFDVGIAEEHATTFAGALARGGLRPFLAVYSTFLQRAFDEIIHDVCLQDLPVVFAVDRAGIVGEDGATHNGIFDIAYLRCIPNMVVMAPKDENEFQQMLYTASLHNGPIAVRYPRGCGPGTELEKEFRKIEIGSGEIVYKSKTHAPKYRTAIFALGSMVYPAIEAARKLEKDGISSVVVNARFVKPLDRNLILEAIESANLMVTVEEGVLEGGFGSAVLELLSAENIAIPALRIGLPGEFIEHGKREQIMEKYGLTPDAICRRIKDYKL